MFIDIHAHVYRKRTPLFNFCLPEELIKCYDELEIERGVLLPIVSPEIYFPQSNEDILEICDTYPDRFIPFCNIDPRTGTNSPRTDFEGILSHYKSRGCKGVGEIMPNMNLMDPLVQNLLGFCEKVGMPIIYDGSDQLTGDFGLYDEPGLPQLEHTLQRFPNLIIFGHGPVFWSEIGKLETPGERSYIFDLKGKQVGRVPTHKITEESVVPKLFRRYPNLRGDLSDFTACNALTRDPEYAAKFIDEFQDKLHFGTDFCFPGMPVKLISVLKEWRAEGRISEAAFQKIARINTIKLLDLDD